MSAGAPMTTFEHVAIICMVIVSIISATVSLAAFVGGLYAFWKFVL